MNQRFSCVITGAESSGKSTLCKQLCTHFEQTHVDEYARSYLAANRNYNYQDLYPIALGQLAQQKAKSDVTRAPIIHDTDLLTIQVWSEYKFGQVMPEIKKMLSSSLPDLYILCNPNIPWVADPLREHPNERFILFEKYKQLIEHLGIPYIVVQGDQKKRFQLALSTIHQLISN